jgi:hypothetical protein
MGKGTLGWPTLSARLFHLGCPTVLARFWRERGQTGPPQLCS